MASLDSLLSTGTGVVKPHLPPNTPPMIHSFLQPALIKSRLFMALKIAPLEKALDTSRPVAMALADPRKFKGGKGLGPAMVALPVKDEGMLVEFLAKKARQGHEVTQWKDHVFKISGRETIRLRLREGFALLAGNEQVLAGAEAVLLPLVRTPPRQMGHLQIHMTRIYERYGKEIDKMVAKLGRKMDADKDVTGTATKIKRWLGYLKGMERIDVVAHLDQSNLKLQVSARAKSAGDFASYLGKLNAGDAWGAKYLPADSALVFISRDDPQRSLQNLEEALQTLEGLVKKEKELATRIDAATFKSWRDNLARGVKNVTGVGAAGIWSASDGSLGMAGASQIKDPKGAREDMLHVMNFIKKELVRFQTKVFKKELKKILPGFKATLKVKQNGLRVAGTKGDLYEFSFKWPRFKDKRKKEKVKKAKKIMTRLLGRKLVVGVVYEKDAALVAYGKDYKKRLARLVAIARGKKSSPLEAKLKPLVAGRKMVLLGYTPVGRLMTQTMRVVENVTKVPADVKDMVGKIIPGPDTEVPAVGLSYLDGTTLTLEAKVSTQAVGMVVRGALHAMMKRMGGGQGAKRP